MLSSWLLRRYRTKALSGLRFTLLTIVLAGCEMGQTAWLLSSCGLLELSANETRTPEEYQHPTRRHSAARPARPNPLGAATPRFSTEAKDSDRSVNQQRGIALRPAGGLITAP